MHNRTTLSGGPATRAVTTSEPGEISFLYFLNCLRSGGALNSLISIRGGAQEERVRGDMQQVSSALAAQLTGRLVLSGAARAIEQHDGHVVVRSDVGGHPCRFVIVAVLPALAGRLQYAVPMPAHRDLLTQRMPMGG